MPVPNSTTALLGRRLPCLCTGGAQGPCSIGGNASAAAAGAWARLCAPLRHGAAARPRRRRISTARVVARNRLLFESHEILHADSSSSTAPIGVGGGSGAGAGACGAELHWPATDSRAKHILQVLGAVPGDRLRVGMVHGPRADAELLTPRRCRSRPGEDGGAAEEDEPGGEGAVGGGEGAVGGGEGAVGGGEKAVEEGTGAVGEGEEGGVRLAIRSWQPPLPPSGVRLLMAAPRPKALKRLWHALPTLGVDAVVVTGAARVERVYFSCKQLQPQVVRQELIQGLEQAGNTRLPSVALTRSLRAAIQLAAGTPLQQLRGFECLLDPGSLQGTPVAPATAATASASQAAVVDSAAAEAAGAGDVASGWGGEEWLFPGDRVAGSASEQCSSSGSAAGIASSRPLLLVAHPGAPALLHQVLAPWLTPPAGQHHQDHPEQQQQQQRHDKLLQHDHPQQQQQQRHDKLLQHDNPQQQHQRQDAEYATKPSLAVPSPPPLPPQTPPPPTETVLAVGPEGGWTSEELEEFLSSGFLPVGMGERVMTTGTAVSALLGATGQALQMLRQLHAQHDQQRS